MTKQYCLNKAVCNNYNTLYRRDWTNGSLVLTLPRVSSKRTFIYADKMPVPMVMRQLHNQSDSRVMRRRAKAYREANKARKAAAKVKFNELWNERWNIQKIVDKIEFYMAVYSPLHPEELKIKNEQLEDFRAEIAALTEEIDKIEY